MKVEFTKAIRGSGGDLGGDGGDLGGGQCPPYVVSASRRKHRESDVWQRRFWEHTIKDEEEFEGYFNYVHYNPVKHRHVSCPHLWEASSFHRWVEKGVYDLHWGCCCAGRDPGKFNFSALEDETGEP
jgi:putative transposase